MSLTLGLLMAAVGATVLGVLAYLLATTPRRMRGIEAAIVSAGPKWMTVALGESAARTDSTSPYVVRVSGQAASGRPRMNVRWIIAAFDGTTFAVIEPGIRSTVARSFSMAEASTDPIQIERTRLGDWDLKNGPLDFNLTASTAVMQALVDELVRSGWLSRGPA